MKHTFNVKSNASILFKQASAARRFALIKAGRQFKREASEKAAYKPGSLGTSVVATAIKEAYGAIVPRAQRKAKERRTGKAAQRFYSHQ